MGNEVAGSPLFLLFWFAVSALGVGIWYSLLPTLHIQLPLPKLFKGLLLVAPMCLLISFLEWIFFPPSSEHFPVTDSSWVIRHVLITTYLMWMVGVMGISYIGLGIIGFLLKFQMASLPAVVFAGVPISILFSYLKSSTASSHDFLYFTTIHALIAFAFCLGSSIPWRTKKA